MATPVYVAICIFACSIIVSCSAQSISLKAPPRARPIEGKATTNGIIDCGVGQLEDVRIIGCTQAPCPLSPGQGYTLEADFRPRDHHWIMRYAMISHQESQLNTIKGEEAIPDSILEPGQLYTFTHEFTASAPFKGLSYIRLELHENWAQELCLIIPVTYL